jgi:cytoskeleton protein RodZ
MKDSIGQQLCRTRKERSLTLEQVARETHMRLHYLQALEADDFDSLPSEVQARGFLRTYAGYLGLDADAILGKVSMEPPAQSIPPPVQTEENSDNGLREPGEAIFSDIGQKLFDRRELLGLSLEDVERHTHLRTHYLRALETGDLEGLPSPVQGRGMLKNYAAFLGMDPEPLLLRFADGLQARLAARQTIHSATKPRSTRPNPKLPASLRRVLSGELLIGTVLVVFLAGFVIWGAVRIFSADTPQEPATTAPSIADVLLATSTQTMTPTTQPTGTPIPAPVILTEQSGGNATEAVTPPAGTGTVQVYVTVHERAWMRVTVDGKVEYDGRVLPDTAYQYAGEKSVEILTGNGAALQIFFNQQDLGAMGFFGQVVDQVYTPDGVLVPTPTVTPTSTATSRPSATPPMTATPTPVP